MTVQQYYEYLSRLDRRDKMTDYEQGKRDCEMGKPHYDKSEAYTQGYSDKYQEQESYAAQ